MADQDLRLLRAAQNQSLFRAVNAKLVELNAVFETLGDRSVFMCECAALDCIQQIDMTLHDYERVRSNPVRFIVAPSWSTCCLTSKMSSSSTTATTWWRRSALPPNSHSSPAET